MLVLQVHISFLSSFENELVYTIFLIIFWLIQIVFSLTLQKFLPNLIHV